MATRLAFDLALHLDMSAYVSSGAITATDADLRRTVFWAAYTVDQLVTYDSICMIHSLTVHVVFWASTLAGLAAQTWRTSLLASLITKQTTGEPANGPPTYPSAPSVPTPACWIVWRL